MEAAYLLVLLETVVVVTVKDPLPNLRAQRSVRVPPEVAPWSVFRSGLGGWECVSVSGLSMWLLTLLPAGPLPPASWARVGMLELLLLMSLDSRRATCRIPNVVTEVSPDPAGPTAPMSLHTLWVPGLGGP